MSHGSKRVPITDPCPACKHWRHDGKICTATYKRTWKCLCANGAVRYAHQNDPSAS